MAGRHFKVDDHADVFIITAHTASQAGATLESVYTGETDATASYKTYQLDYDLASDLLYLMSPLYAFQNSRQEISQVSLRELTNSWPINRTGSGVPTAFAMIGEKKIRFSHYGGLSSTKLIKVNYEYIKEPIDLADDAVEPLVPRRHRMILADWTLAFLLEKKEDTRANNALQAAGRGLLAMAKENRRRMMLGTGIYGKIQPRQGQLARFNQPLRTESGMIIG